MATSIKIDDQLKSRVQHLANLRRRSAHWIMREALASWAEYQETGRHLSGDEVRAWLNKWGAEDEGTPPECHD